MLRRCLCTVAALTVFAAAQATPFDVVEVAVDEGANLRLSRNTSTQAAFGPDGRLHLVYWVGAEETNVAEPSFVLYRSWTPGTGWGGAVTVDNSFNPSSQRLGGRNPSLAVSQAGDIWIAWHDYRHVNAVSNSIDNIEIYIDVLRAGDASFSGNIRLTETSAAHSGDNGYAPQLAIAPDGRVHVVWYDFNAAAETSDIYWRFSDSSGVFPAEPLSSHRVTNLNDRSPSPGAFTLPAVAIDTDGSVHTVWRVGTGAADVMYYSRLSGASLPLTGTQISAASGSFFDPPRLVSSPLGGIWLVYTERGTNALGDITLRFLPTGSTTFDAPVVAGGGGGAITNQPSAAVDNDGIVHLAYVEQGIQSRLYYRTWDPALSELSSPIEVAPTPGSWARPSVVIDNDGNPWILFEEDLGTTLGRIWVARPDVETSIENWMNWR